MDEVTRFVNSKWGWYGLDRCFNLAAEFLTKRRDRFAFAREFVAFCLSARKREKEEREEGSVQNSAI